MAFSPVIRRAATHITPLAFQAVRSKIVESNRPNPNLESCRANPLLLFSTASIVVEKKKKEKKQRLQSDDGNLSRVLNSEIKCVVDSDLFTIAVDVPSGFPFKVEDNAGGRTIVLTREFEGENIRIEVDMPASDEGEIESSIPIAVTVSKPDGDSSLQFGARCFPGRFSVHSSSLRKSGDSEDGSAYTGPNFLNLSEDLRSAFDKYLESRGLTSSMANFLLEYIMCKDAEEYLRWLRTLKKFIER